MLLSRPIREERPETAERDYKRRQEQQKVTIRSRSSCRIQVHSVTMKYAIIATLLVFALAQGSQAQDADIEKIGQYLEEMKIKLTQEMSTLFENQDLANQAQTFFEDRRTQLEALAPQVHDQLKTVAATVEEQFKPLAANMQEKLQSQVQPMLENFQKQMEGLFQKMTEQAKALTQ